MAPPDVEPLFEVVAERDRLRVQVAELRRAYLEKEAEVAALTARLRPGSYSQRITADFEIPPPPSAPRSIPRDDRPARLAPDPAPMAYAPVADAHQGIDFGAVAKLSPAELDTLPYGLITLDAEGRVLHYNDTESRLVGLPKERVLGKSFFRDVAPCTRIRDFEGRFLELARDPGRVRVQTFDFVFRFPRVEQHVTVIMTPARTRGQFHLALVRRAIVPT
jgi:photoactive yellow protein